MVSNIPLGNCHKHPDRKAIAACSVCSVAMCEECTLYTKQGKPICHSCMLKLAERENAQQKAQEEAELKQKIAKQKQAKLRNRTIFWTIIAIISAVVIAAEVAWYKSLSTTDITKTVPLSETVSDDEALIGFVFSAILLYKESNGEYPETLSELDNAGMLGTKDKPDISRLRYKRTSKGFKLWLENAPPPLDRTVFTESGPKSKEAQR